MSIGVLKSICVDFSDESLYQYITVFSEEIYSRTIEITPLNNGEEYIIPAETTARLEARKPDNKPILLDSKIDFTNNKIYIELTPKCLDTPGVTSCQIGLYGVDNRFIASSYFYIDVYRSALSGNGSVNHPGCNSNVVESSPEYQSFRVALLSVDEVQKRANAAILKAENDISNAIQNMDVEIDDAVNKVAESAEEAIENVKETNESVSKNELEREENETQRQQNEQLRDAAEEDRKKEFEAMVTDFGDLGGIAVSKEEPESERVVAWIDPSDDEKTLFMTSDDIAHELGDSEEKVLSQKAATREFDNTMDRLDEIRSADMKNMFNSERLLEIEGCVVENGEYTYQARNGELHGIFSIDCEENTQYSLSLFAKIVENTVSAINNGLKINLHYAGGTTSSVLLPNDTTEFTKVEIISDPKKEKVVGISLNFGNGINNYWTIKEVQFEKGNAITDFVPYYTAFDRKARASIEELTPRVNNAEEFIGKTTETQQTDNLLNSSFLKVDGITEKDGEFIGTAKAFDSIPTLPITFEDGYYTISFWAYTEGNASIIGNGVNVRVVYSDGKNNTIQIPNSTNQWTKFVLHTDGRKVISADIGYNNGTDNIWHLKQFQVEKGKVVTPYEDSTIVTAVDKTARAKLDEFSKLLKASTWEAEGGIREKQLRQDYLDSGDSERWYGVQWAEESNPDNVIAISSVGDENLHTTLPIQNKMRRCVVQDGMVNYYLDSDNSELKADGTPARLDGTDGNVMVEIPEFFYRCEEATENGVRTIKLKISEQGLPGFIFSRKRYTSAYEATVDRENDVLASVCTTLFARGNAEVKSEASGKYIVGDVYSYGVKKTAERNGFTNNAAKYRGGVNDATLDSETNPTSQNYARNQLGLPIACVNRTMCREYSDVDNGIFMDLYDTMKALWILAQVEFKTRNIQKPLTDGGLGTGATVYPDYNAYEAFFSPQGGISCLPCGITNSLGNKSGEVYYKMVNVPVSSTGSKDTIEYTRFADLWMPVMSYRGIENWYGHLYSIADQISIEVTPTDTYYDGHEGESYWRYSDVTYYYEPNPYLTNDEISQNKSLGTYNFMCNTRTVSSLLLGKNAHILHIGTTTHAKDDNAHYYCDCCEVLGNGVGTLTMNGRIVSSSLVGFHFIVTEGNLEYARPSDGTRVNMF